MSSQAASETECALTKHSTPAHRPCQGPGITEEQQAKPQEYDERDTLALEAEVCLKQARYLQTRPSTHF